VNKSREVICAEEVKCMGEMTVAHKNFVRKPEDH
jgi:hypothetical protein